MANETTSANLECPDCGGVGYGPAYWGASEQQGECETCRGTGAVICGMCPHNLPDEPAVTVSCEANPYAGGVSSVPVCESCARAAVGTIDYYEVAPWLDEDFHTDVTTPVARLSDSEILQLTRRAS